jgi:hypothetical protein
MGVKTDYIEIYKARNRVKRSRKIYTYEAIDNIAKTRYPEMSLSEFYHYAGCLVIGRCGVKLDIFKDEDKQKISELHRGITAPR